MLAATVHNAYVGKIVWRIDTVQEESGDLLKFDDEAQVSTKSTMETP